MQDKLKNHENADRFDVLLDSEDVELICYRYLKDKGFHVDAAFTVMCHALDMRDELKLDEVVDVDDTHVEDATPYHALMKKYIPEIHFSGVSKKGNPCSFQLKGRINVPEFIANVTLEEYQQWLGYTLVNQMRHLNKLSRKEDRLLGLTVVVDAKDVAMPNMRYFPYFKTEVEMRQTMSPEVLAEAVVVNAPWFFNVIWKIIQPVLDKATLEKIGIVNQDQLKNWIDPQYIPTVLGGEDPAPKLIIPDPAKGMQAETISAGRKFECSKSAKSKDMAITWRFQILARDIGYEVIFQDFEGIEEVIHEYEKVSENHVVQEGLYVTSRAGKVTLKLDNSFSYWNSKNVLWAMSEFQDVSAANGDILRYSMHEDVVRKLTN
eukprot:TRINITY_DN3374_c0_g1_i1.p1 TRINITY_DN3374_c0_g1~~TRINITY_DN3374_c0_g1_i1.p1  ORF type:complete len:377 (+),score=109.62 TRINITY_DN3374_c0_g1_i1:191-1321(+)